MNIPIAVHRLLPALLASVFFASPFDVAHGNTIVTATGECERVVTVKIEIYSDQEPLTWTDEELEAMDAETRERITELMESHSSYGEGVLKQIASEWQAEIEKVWNGPTDEQVKDAAEDLGVSEEDRKSASNGGNNELRKQLDDRAREMMAAAGGQETCTEINCCKIFFKSEVKIRGAEPTPGYHQVEVMVTGYRSNVTSKDGKTENNHGGTTGRWAYDPHNAWDASAAHETGHLMGLGDEYHEEGGNNEGHDHDVMTGSYGWPQEDSLQDILGLGGAECDCCPDDERASGLFQRFNSSYQTAGDAMLTNNCPILHQLQADYEAQLANAMGATSISMTDKANLVNRINQRLAKVRKALLDCGDPVTETGGLFQTPGLLLGSDLWEWCRFTPEEMTPIPIPGPGDDPRDIPIGGPVTTPDDDPRDTDDPRDGPEDDGDDPRDTPTPVGGGDAPGSTPGSTPPGGLITVTPGGGGDDPRDTPPPEDDDPSDVPVPPIYVNVKATSSAVATGATASDISGLQIKLYPTEVANPTLPGTGVPKDADIGAGDGPVQGVTGKDGTVRIAADPTVLGLNGVTPTEMTVDINIDPTVTGVVVPEGTAVPGYDQPDETVSIGADTFSVYYLPDVVAQKLAGGPVEINICGEKKPVGRGSFSLTVIPAGADLPGATVSLQGMAGGAP